MPRDLYRGMKMSENKKYFHPDLLKQEISQISAGDIIAVKFGQKLKEFFVYDVTSSLEDPVLFLCIRVRKKEEALKENGLPGYFYNCSNSLRSWLIYFSAC